MRKRKILFISHDASRTGAPILLLSIIQYFNRSDQYLITILLKESGILTPEFEKVGKVKVLNKSIQKKNIFLRVFDKLIYQSLIKPIHANLIKLILNIEQFDYIYANTASVGDVLAFLKPKKPKIIIHIHELKHTILSYGRNNNKAISEFCHKYIAVSFSVKNVVSEIFDKDLSNIHTIYGFVPQWHFEANLIDKEHCNQSPYKDKSMVVIGSGNTDWRKGADIFVQLANIIVNKFKHKDIRFVWVGNNEGWLSDFYEKLKYDVEFMHLDNYLDYTGLVNNPLDYYNQADIFVLTSREDPFPLVCLEAASLSKPIICFKDAGGMQEFVEEDAGFIVPYGDVQSMAEKIIYLKNNPEMKTMLGKRAKEKVQERCSLDVNAEKIRQIVESL